MRSIKGTYDGEKIEFLEKAQNLKPGKVIITFLEDSDDIETLRDYGADEDALDFWKEEEDLYQDFLKKK